MEERKLTLQQLIDNSFKASLKDFQNSGKQLDVGDCVIARMRGYCPWPAKITGITKDRRRIKCYFYGSHDNGSVDAKQVIPFEDAHETIRLLCIRRPNEFIKGIREAELENGVPDELSCIRLTESVNCNIN